MYGLILIACAVQAIKQYVSKNQEGLAVAFSKIQYSTINNNSQQASKCIVVSVEYVLVVLTVHYLRITTNICIDDDGPPRTRDFSLILVVVVHAIYNARKAQLPKIASARVNTKIGPTQGLPKQRRLCR